MRYSEMEREDQQDAILLQVAIFQIIAPGLVPFWFMMVLELIQPLLIILVQKFHIHLELLLQLGMVLS